MKLKCLFFIFTLLLAGCANKPAPARLSPSATDAALAADLATLPQDPLFYARKADHEQGTLTTAFTEDGKTTTPEAFAAKAREHFFSPWLTEPAPLPLNSAMGGIYWLNPQYGFIENLRPFPQERWAALIKNCNIPAYPSRNLRAITVQNCALRLMPTHTPYFFNPNKAGQGYPFDYFQNSSLPVGSPVRIMHVSLDSAWALVQSPTASGWVDINALALVDNKFVIEWLSRPMAAITTENAKLFSHNPKRLPQKEPAQIYDNAEFLKPLPSVNELPTPPVFASIGAILPYEPFARKFGPLYEGEQALYYPQKNSAGYAVMHPALLNKSDIAPWPLPLERELMAKLMQQMLGQPYGWGGYGGNRDCSATLRDLLLPFGIWLPRNSRAQAATGAVTQLGTLAPAQKEELILQNAVPFTSLIGMPGHIVLYLGEYEGRAVIFHNMWGLRVNVPGSKEQGRAVIGKAVITTLTPGAERPDIATPESLRQNIDRLSQPLGK